MHTRGRESIRLLGAGTCTRTPLASVLLEAEAEDEAAEPDDEVAEVDAVDTDGWLGKTEPPPSEKVSAVVAVYERENQVS
jgi:hypothetical protein